MCSREGGSPDERSAKLRLRRTGPLPSQGHNQLLLVRSAGGADAFEGLMRGFSTGFPRKVAQAYDAD